MGPNRFTRIRPTYMFAPTNLDFHIPTQPPNDYTYLIGEEEEDWWILSRCVNISKNKKMKSRN